MYEPSAEPVSLRRVFFVFVLVLMLSFNPVVNTQSMRNERAQVMYVLPRRTRRSLRGRRRRRAALHRETMLISYETYLSLQG